MISDENESSEKSVIVKKSSKIDYFIVNKSIVEDPELTWSAKGLLCYLLYKSEENQSYKHLKEESYDKAEFIKAVSELKEMQYIALEDFKADKFIKVIGGF